MNKREYPLFLIDRSKNESYAFDYIVCLDQLCGFVARVVPFFEDAAYAEFIAQSRKVKGFEIASIAMKFKTGGLVVVIEDYLHAFELSREIETRVKTLLKKALKKYLHAEVDRTAQGDLNIENQIKQQQLTIERAKSQYTALMERSSKDEADYAIALAEATLDTLKKYRDNQQFFILNMN